MVSANAQVHIDSAKETTHFLDVARCSCSRMAEMHIFYGLRPVGVNQYPSRLVSWIVHTHLMGLMVKPLASRQDKTSFRRIWCSSQVMPKTPMLSRYILKLWRPHRTCSIICGAKLGTHLRSMGRHLYLYLPKGVMVTHSSWDSSSRSKV